MSYNVTGTGGNDNLNQSADTGPGSIFGLDGNDTIRTGTGAATVEGGSGEDTVILKAGNTGQVTAGTENDSIWDQNQNIGSMILFGNEGADTIDTNNSTNAQTVVGGNDSADGSDFDLHRIRSRPDVRQWRRRHAAHDGRCRHHDRRRRRRQPVRQWRHEQPAGVGQRGQRPLQHLRRQRHHLRRPGQRLRARDQRQRPVLPGRGQRHLRWGREYGRRHSDGRERCLRRQRLDLHRQRCRCGLRQRWQRHHPLQ